MSSLISWVGLARRRRELLTSNGIAFPGSPKLLISATNPVKLDLSLIPHSDYLSPEAMTSPTVNGLRLTFQSPRSRPLTGKADVHLHSEG